MKKQNKGAGKGPETRKGADFKKYRENYDQIFGKVAKPEKTAKAPAGKR